MIKNAMKSVLKKVALTVRNHVRAWEEEHTREERAGRRNYDEDDFAYPWLNDQFTQISKGGAMYIEPLTRGASCRACTWQEPLE